MYLGHRPVPGVTDDQVGWVHPDSQVDKVYVIGGPDVPMVVPWSLTSHFHTRCSGGRGYLRRGKKIGYKRFESVWAASVVSTKSRIYENVFSVTSMCLLWIIIVCLLLLIDKAKPKDHQSIKRELKTKPIYECRCNERLKTKVEESTHLAYTGLLVELEHLKIETTLIDEMFASVMGEYVFLKW